MKNFADQLKPLVERAGTARAADLCGVTPRTIQLWLANPAKPPCRAMQVGALSLLRDAASAAPKTPRPRKGRAMPSTNK
mgnify:CR=1 FL=1